MVPQILNFSICFTSCGVWTSYFQFPNVDFRCSGFPSYQHAKLKVSNYGFPMFHFPEFDVQCFELRSILLSPKYRFRFYIIEFSQFSIRAFDASAFIFSQVRYPILGFTHVQCLVFDLRVDDSSQFHFPETRVFEFRVSDFPHSNVRVSNLRIWDFHFHEFRVTLFSKLSKLHFKATFCICRLKLTF